MPWSQPEGRRATQSCLRGSRRPPSRQGPRTPRQCHGDLARTRKTCVPWRGTESVSGPAAWRASRPGSWTLEVELLPPSGRRTRPAESSSVITHTREPLSALGVPAGERRQTRTHGGPGPLPYGNHYDMEKRALHGFTYTFWPRNVGFFLTVF